MTELRCPSLDYVYSMTWAEFLIRLDGYRRVENNDMMRFRHLLWIIYMAPHENPKKMKKNIKTFWPIATQAPEVTDKMRERIKAVQEQYRADLKKVTNG